MPQPDPTHNWPTYWFARLEEALHAGDFDRAADTARELRRLGVAVSYPRPVFAAADAPAKSKAVARA